MPHTLHLGGTQMAMQHRPGERARASEQIRFAQHCAQLRRTTGRRNGPWPGLTTTQPLVLTTSWVSTHAPSASANIRCNTHRIQGMPTSATAQHRLQHQDRRRLSRFEACLAGNVFLPSPTQRPGLVPAAPARMILTLLSCAVAPAPEGGQGQAASLVPSSRCAVDARARSETERCS